MRLETYHSLDRAKEWRWPGQASKNQCVLNPRMGKSETGMSEETLWMNAEPGERQGSPFYGFFEDDSSNAGAKPAAMTRDQRKKEAVQAGGSGSAPAPTASRHEARVYRCPAGLTNS